MSFVHYAAEQREKLEVARAWMRQCKKGRNFPGDISVSVALREGGTVMYTGGRQTGKTTSILELATEKSVVLCHGRLIANGLRVRIGRDCKRVTSLADHKACDSLRAAGMDYDVETSLKHIYTHEWLGQDLNEADHPTAPEIAEIISQADILFIDDALLVKYSFPEIFDWVELFAHNIEAVVLVG